MANSTALLHIEPVTPVVGAVVDGVDLASPLEPDTVRAIRSAVLEHGVLFFRGQDLPPAEFAAFMSNFGTPCMDPFSIAADAVLPPEDTIENVTLIERGASGSVTLSGPDGVYALSNTQLLVVENGLAGPAIPRLIEVTLDPD